MIAADTSSLISYFIGEQAEDVSAIRSALFDGTLVLPPAVLAEVLSDRGAATIEADLVAVQILSITEGYWQRAGRARRILQSYRLTAGLSDALIAQSCIDHDVPLITRDRDFRHFAKHCGLKLA